MKSQLHALKGIFSSHPARKWFILTTVLIGATMSALDVSIINVAMPTLKSTFGVSLSVIEWLTMAYMLGLVIFLPLFGKLSDIYGRSKLYNIGFIIFSAGSLLCALSSTAAFLITYRVVQAIGAGLLQVNSVALISNAFPANERGKAIGIQSAVQAISMAIGPFVGGILIGTVGWRAIFFINVPIGIFGMMAALLILPADREIRENLSQYKSAISSWMFVVPPAREMKKKEKIDYLGAALFASGLSLIVLAFNEGANLGWGSSFIIAYFISGFFLLALFIFVELKVKHPLIDISLFKNSTFLLGNLAGLLSYYVLFALLFLMPFYLERILGYSVALTGFLLTPLLIAMAVAAPISGHISDRNGPRIMTTAGMFVSALACLWLLFMGESPSVPVMVGMMIFLGFGIGAFIPSNNNAIISSAPGEKWGTAGGLMNMTRSLGLIFGVNISGMVFTSLEHQYLAEKGFTNVSRAFSNPNIPLAVKDDAFMHGFTMVIVILLGINILAALLSAIRKPGTAGIIDHDAAGAAVISSGFFRGFSQETAGMALFVTALLFTGYIGLLVLARPTGATGVVPDRGAAVADAVQARNGPAAYDPKSLALAYYVKKYNDPNVTIEIRHMGNYDEADIRKFGFLIKRLDINADKITERRTGIREWQMVQMILVN